MASAKMDPSAISTALRNQVAITDAQFDGLYPAGQRFRSYAHWTPIDVALRACALLAPQPGQRVLDVGSGVGKLCLVCALTTRATWVGVETAPEMIRVAGNVARRLRIGDRIQFVHGDANALDWSGFDAIYMFNPFAEGLLKARERPGAHERFEENIAHARRQLASTAPGTRLVTYHGFGGELPDGFDLVHQEPARQDRLCLWMRRA
jgi:SAM-dependent methyltransferase